MLSTSFSDFPRSGGEKPTQPFKMQGEGGSILPAAALPMLSSGLRLVECLQLKNLRFVNESKMRCILLLVGCTQIYQYLILEFIFYNKQWLLSVHTVPGPALVTFSGPPLFSLTAQEQRLWVLPSWIPEARHPAGCWVPEPQGTCLLM